MSKRDDFYTFRKKAAANPIKNRSISVTPPIVWNKAEGTVNPKGVRGEKSKDKYTDLVSEVVKARPSKEGVAAEQKVNRGMLSGIAGVAGDDNKEERGR